MLPPRGPQYGNCKPTRWTWHELPDVTCLDGSPAGFYHTRAIGPVFAHSWVIYFEGGGWCVSPEDCALRGTTTRGSSRHWPGNGTRFGQLLHMCCFATPFCRFHRVMLKSCVGGARLTLTESKRSDQVLFDWYSSLAVGGSRYGLPWEEVLAQARAAFPAKGTPARRRPRLHADEVQKFRAGKEAEALVAAKKRDPGQLTLEEAVKRMRRE